MGGGEGDGGGAVYHNMKNLPQGGGEEGKDLLSHIMHVTFDHKEITSSFNSSDVIGFPVLL